MHVDRTFTHYMRALGVPKDQCLEFIRRQAKLASLSRGKYNCHLYVIAPPGPLSGAGYPFP